MVLGFQVAKPTIAAAPTVAIAPGGAVSNTVALGRVLYTKYVYFFQGAGLILLVAMIGAIVLTLRHREGVKRQSVSVQVNRQPADAMAVIKVASGESIIPPKKPAPARASGGVRVMSGSFETKNMTPLIATLLSSVGARIRLADDVEVTARQLTLKKRRAGGFTMVVVAGLLWGLLIVGWLEIQRDMTAALWIRRAPAVWVNVMHWDSSS